MNKTYIVNENTTLSKISARVYGDPTRWPEIFRANQFRLKSGDPDNVFAGEKLIIPEVQKAPSIAEINGQGMMFVVDGQIIPVTQGRIIRTMDTASDAWSIRFPWSPGTNLKLDQAIKPYAYPNASAYIGGELLVNGLLYTVDREKTKDGVTVGLTGYSFTADIVDSTLKPPYERNNITLEQLAPELVNSSGIRAVFNTETGGPFDRVTANEGDTIFSHLAKLASQRGVLVSSTVDGDLLFHKAITTGSIVGTIDENQPISESYRARFDGRQRFNIYKCINSDSGASLSWTDTSSEQKTQIAIDEEVPRSRFLTFQTNDTTFGNIGNAAEWRRSRQIIDALSIEFPVPGWYAPNGFLWQENTLVSVVSETIGTANGFTFLIRAVEFILEDSRKETILSLIPPQAYSGEQLGDIWT